MGTSVVLCHRQPRVDFRYASLAAKLARHCNLSRRDAMQQIAPLLGHLVDIRIAHLRSRHW
jgi:hypothetical protein